MMQQVSTKVPLVIDNVSKCLCPGCPVQAQSKCVAGLKPGLAAALKNNPLRHEDTRRLLRGGESHLRRH